MARIRDEDYAYAAAHVRAIEPKLMDQSKLDRLLEAADSSDGLKLLMESGYGTDQLNSAGTEAGNMDVLLSSELKKAYDLLLEILPDPQAVYLFMRRYDYLNAKLILKAEFLGIDAMKSLSPMGTIKPAKLYKYITDRKLDELPEIFRKAILESLDAFSQTGDPQVIDFILDRASFENMAQDAKDSEEPFLIELVEKLCDMANIRVFVRAKLLSKSGDFIKNALVKGGSVPAETYGSLADKSLSQFFDALKGTSLASLAGELSQTVKDSSGISEFEKILDDYIILFLRRSKYMILSIEPVIAYLFYKETEIKNARLILTGKANKVSQETIRERLRLGYA